MENVNKNEMAVVRMVEAVLFTMLGIFCLAYPEQGPAVTIGSVPVMAKDLLGVAYIVTGYAFGRWPVVHFIRPRSMEYKGNSRIMEA